MDPNEQRRRDKIAEDEDYARELARDRLERRREQDSALEQRITEGEQRDDLNELPLP